MNMISTVTVVFGFMLVLFFRMRRIYKVFTLYENYLKEQINDVNPEKGKFSSQEEQIQLERANNNSLNSESSAEPIIKRESEVIRIRENIRDLKYIKSISELSENKMIM